MTRVTILGTGTSQGVPIIGCECRVCTSSDPHDNRLRSSVLVTYGDTVVVIDAGPDFRQQMLRAR
ncbi:MAG: MBL fold metallo-hydrolase, partial [Bacteroidota bacterium]